MIWRAANAPGAPTAGPQVSYGDRPSISLGHVNHNSEGGTGSVSFRIYTPDARMRVKVSVLFVRDAGQSGAVSGNGATLYLGEEEKDNSGKFGSYVPCTDILRDASGNVIHQSSPLAIPEDTALDGFTMEFVTAADAILGIFSTGQDGPGGHWILQVRFQPDGQRLCDADWEWAKRGCHATLLGPELNLP